MSLKNHAIIANCITSSNCVNNVNGTAKLHKTINENHVFVYKEYKIFMAMLT